MGELKAGGLIKEGKDYAHLAKSFILDKLSESLYFIVNKILFTALMVYASYSLKLHVN